ncbi:MAG TPA: S8 family serine peptidase, partial [Verrucomicrobiae bacterium]
LVGGDDGNIATPTVTQQLGFNGSNVVVSVADTGLDTGDTNDMHPDLAGRVAGLMYYTTNVVDASDGYGHGTHCAGIVAGNAATLETDPDTGQFYGLGVASGASLFIQRIFDDNANELDFTSDETLTHDAVRHGAKIGSNSWGNDVQGDYDTDCAQFDELVRDADAGTAGDQPYIEEFSAGNAGPQAGSIGSPAAAKNVIATGASENVPGTLAMTYGLYADGPDTMCDFSSRGPCADGRIKPDLVAPGSWIASAASRVTDETGVAWTVIDDLYVYMGGTSMAGPYAAGAAAVFVQFYRSTHANAMPSPALVKAALINSADELDQANGGPGPVPNNDEGWGRINLQNVVVTNVNSAPRFYQYVDQTVLLTNSRVYSQHVFVQGAGEPLKITLAYTDVPGFPGAIPALVNDLDLEVVAPDGTLYRGNQFGAGESVPNPPTPDKLNNVEGVFLSQPAPGDYLIRVRASKIVQDAVSNTPAIDQDFALVSSGDFVRPGTGFILLDRPSYTAPSTMQIEVFDAARAASNSVSVLVTNLTQHTGMANLLQASGNFGAFTGAVATVTGAAGAGQIQIANGDNLEADYFDSGGIKRTATAVADLAGPNISSVASGIDVGVLTITWQTTEPAASIVHYGTNSSNLNLGVTNLSLVTSHTVKLTGLIPGKTYYYLIVASDAAGNVTTNNNSGANYTFIGVAAPTVLLVDAYDTAAEQLNGATVIPDSVYTNVFASAGVSYAFWKVNVRGSPQLADLKPFPVVVWRLTDDAVNYGGYDYETFQTDPTATNNTLNAQQQYMIQSYLNGGGSFFMASMEILSHLGNVSFRRNVLQVAGFKQNSSLLGVCSDCDEDFGVPAIFGAPASIASGIYATLDYTNYPFADFDEFSYGPDFSDIFT